MYEIFFVPNEHAIALFQTALSCDLFVNRLECCFKVMFFIGKEFAHDEICELS